MNTKSTKYPLMKWHHHKKIKPPLSCLYNIGNYPLLSTGASSADGTQTTPCKMTEGDF